MNLTKHQRRRWLNQRATLMVRFGRVEKIYYAPPGFYKWSTKARRIYMSRFAKWTSVSNGVPWQCSGSFHFTRSEVETPKPAANLPHQFKPTEDERAMGMVVKNAQRCQICQGPADRYKNRFQCRDNPGHVADLNTGIFSDCSKAC